MSEIVIHEHFSSSYTPRTFVNAQRADLTFALAADLGTSGEKLTHKAAGDNYIGVQLIKGVSYVSVARKLYKELVVRNANTLNIAGNGIYTLAKHGFTQKEVNQYVYNLVHLIHQARRDLVAMEELGLLRLDGAGAATSYVRTNRT